MLVVQATITVPAGKSVVPNEQGHGEGIERGAHHHEVRGRPHGLTL